MPRLEVLECREVLSGSVGFTETFDSTPTGQLSAGWAQWGNNTPQPFAASADRSVSPTNSLAIRSTASGSVAQAWLDAEQPADVQVSASVYLDSLIPARVLAHGSGLDSAAPTYYAASITRGLQVQLLAVSNGKATVLGQVKSASWFEAKWARVTLYANGDNLRVQVSRLDDGRFLDASGQWQTNPTWALNLTDRAIASPGKVGLARPASYTGSLFFDDFRVADVVGDRQAPTVTIQSPATQAMVSGTVHVRATATDNVGVIRVEYLMDDVLRYWHTSASAGWDFDTTTAANGSHTLTVLAYDAVGNVGRASVTIQAANDTAPPALPDIPHHYSHIRLAQLAYGTIGSVEELLLRDSVDLVIVDVPVKNRPTQIQSVAPDTPQLLYTNLSSVYTTSLTDWLGYADAHGLSRESAFYHASRPIAYSGHGGSTQPVNWFWKVYRQGTQTADLTLNARGGSVPLPASGEALALGSIDRYREINFDLLSGASGGWSAVLEYVSAVDASGTPTAWRTLTTLADTTSGFTTSGRLTFDPPADWVAASVTSGSPRLFYVRVRAKTAGTAPVARSILGRDYVGAANTTTGTIPVFNASADANHDGYLNDAEYARRAAGQDARFVSESRLFTYGPQRLATNPSDAAFRAWATDYQVRSLDANPLMDGLFIDNSFTRPTFAAGDVLEPTAAYSNDYASLTGAVGRAIAPRWVLVNSAGGNASTDATVRQAQGYFEEFALRPMGHNYLQFEQLAGLVARRAALTSPSSYAVIDSNPQGGSVSDPRMQIGMLAYYYLIGDPRSTFLDINGGYSPGSSWTQHWYPAAAFDVGQPSGTWSPFASGADPAAPALSYRVYQREYTNALILYKPLSFGNNSTGSLSDSTATTHALGGKYFVLKADGTLGNPVSSITLRNGEGAILIKASAVGGA